jgi:hypothetical protein
MRTLLIAFVATGLLGICPAQQSKDTTHEKTAAAGTTLTGCLEKSGSDFTLTDKSGKETMVMGSADLAKHAGHQVTLSGKMEKKGDEGHFMVSKITHISPTCEK